MTNKEIFRRLYLEFENETKNNNKFIKKNGENQSLWEIVLYLKNNRINPYYSEFDFLDFCRICRNKISHDVNEDKYIEFTNEMIDKFEQIIEKIKNPDDAYKKSTKNIFVADINDNVKRIMKVMIEKNFTHIPIYNQNGLIGIFSENCIFNYLMDNEIIEIDENTLFNEIIDYININNSKESVKFVKKDELYDNVVREFVKQFKEGKKLSCIMITQNGKIGEKVIGILTSWDIIGRV